MAGSFHLVILPVKILAIRSGVRISLSTPLSLKAMAIGPTTIGRSSGALLQRVGRGLDLALGRVERRVGAGEVDLAGVEAADARARTGRVVVDLRAGALLGVGVDPRGHGVGLGGRALAVERSGRAGGGGAAGAAADPLGAGAPGGCSTCRRRSPLLLQAASASAATSTPATEAGTVELHVGSPFVRCVFKRDAKSDTWRHGVAKVNAE